MSSVLLKEIKFVAKKQGKIFLETLSTYLRQHKCLRGSLVCLKFHVRSGRRIKLSIFELAFPRAIPAVRSNGFLFASLNWSLSDDGRRENVVEEDREWWRAEKSNNATLSTSYLVDGTRVKRFNVNFQPVIFTLWSRWKNGETRRYLPCSRVPKVEHTSRSKSFWANVFRVNLADSLRENFILFF